MFNDAVTTLTSVIPSVFWAIMPQMAPKFKLITLSGSKRNESFLFHLQVIKKQQKLENVSQETKGCVLSESLVSLDFHSLIYFIFTCFLV